VNRAVVGLGRWTGWVGVGRACCSWVNGGDRLLERVRMGVGEASKSYIYPVLSCLVVFCFVFTESCGVVSVRVAA
jgi:hypothetical protein